MDLPFFFAKHFYTRTSWHKLTVRQSLYVSHPSHVYLVDRCASVKEMQLVDDGAFWYIVCVLLCEIQLLILIIIALSRKCDASAF